MAPQLSLRTRQLVEKLFEAGERAEASRLLIEECGNNLPFCQDEDAYRLERIRFAALRLSLGYLDDLRECIGLARRDWRDVLVWAGFGESVTAHREWADQVLKGSAEPRVVVVMGATGAGKTTVGARLARTLGWMYVETDNLLSTEDFNKAIRGAPLTETVLETWLDKISVLIGKYVDKKQSVVLACSALREAYRQRLQGDERVRWVYLRGTYQQLEERQKKRQSRLPYLARLAYESKLLEEPQDSLVVDISWSPQEIVDTILSDLKQRA